MDSNLFTHEEIDFSKFASDGITVLKPSRKMVGVTELGYDWSLADTSEVTAIEMNETEALSIDDMLPIPGVAVDPLVTVDESSMHKASLYVNDFLVSLYHLNHLKRVRGMYQGGRGSSHSFTISTILKISVNTKPVNYCDTTDLDVLDVKEMEIKVAGDKCVWKGALKEVTTISGEKWFPIAPAADPDLPGQFIFDRQMLLDVAALVSWLHKHNKICKKNVNRKKATLLSIS